MASAVPELDGPLIDWIGEQHVFFVATAPSGDDGHVNLSPKGHDAFRVLDPLRVAYLDLTGSGAETIAHLRQNGRITFMFSAFKGPPRILRLYGTGVPHLKGTARYDELAPRFPDLVGARAIIEATLDRVSTSCGFSIPKMDYVGDRSRLLQWAERKGDDGLVDYRAKKNARSIDGLAAIDG
jgi:hypothetical protein